MSSNEAMFQRIAEVLPSMIASVEPLKKRLARAAVTGSRWDRVMALETPVDSNSSADPGREINCPGYLQNI